MSINSIKTFDDTTTYSFLSSRPVEVGRKSYFEYYNEYGGYSTIEEIVEECEKDKGNDEYHFSEIQKYESLRKFQKEGLINTGDLNLVKKLTKMNLKQLQSFFQYKTSIIFSHINCGEVVEYNLSDDLDQAIDKMNQGEAMGLPLHDSPRLSKKIKGWRKGELIYLVLSSGVGKSSIAMEKFVLSLYENDQKGMMFTNEENVWKSRNLLMATVSSKKLNKPINREKLSEGKFDEATLEKLYNARDWIQQYPRDLVKFYDLKKYRVEDVLSRIQMMKPLNYSYGLLDTFKPDNSANEAARWEAFSNAAQAIFDCIKPEANNLGMLATVQLKIGKEYRFLDLSAIGKSLEIVEVASVVLMGRLLYNDEMPGKKEEIFAYNWEKSDFDGKWHKKEYKLDPEKTYLIVFIAKNRAGETSEQIIYEVNYGINSFKEVAYSQMGKKSNSAF
ncbi:DnaB-like helicase C-terminal domain-containing protein [Paenibacillus sp. 1781tsa1]|uniref:DnaB-like helicase C-terminal domain-containing protein n=1 Tax=Paenibacillus sp. 1781tsa1 TaxID=2953810 RepID=UPI00209F77E7|nr:DnaB-like helicase C-terminal domain-containing protein [Paenibacillus sp. 1781tsa1]MCP1184959.1 replication protein [Paenibacillus sp. 1781tsa1]